MLCLNANFLYIINVIFPLWRVEELVLRFEPVWGLLELETVLPVFGRTFFKFFSI